MIERLGSQVFEGISHIYVKYNNGNSNFYSKFNVPKSYSHNIKNQLKTPKYQKNTKLIIRKRTQKHPTNYHNA